MVGECHCDVLAGRAAELCQLSSETRGEFKARAELSTIVLRKPAAIAIKLAVAARAANRVVRIVGRQESNAKPIDLWARRSGHALDSNIKSVRCKLRVDDSRNLTFIESGSRVKLDV